VVIEAEQLTSIAPSKNGETSINQRMSRKNYLFLGLEKGSKSAAICYSLIGTCKLNGVKPQSWLTYALTNI